MKFSSELAVSMMDFLVGCSVVKRCCEAHGISEAGFWLWVKKSKADPPELPSFEWMGMDLQFHEGVQTARRLYANGLLDMTLERARYGSNRKVIYQGKECFAIDRSIPPGITDPDVLDMLYSQPDHYLRDDQGRLVYLTEAVDPPVALTLAVLASQFEIFQPHSSQSIEVINREGMGVLHVGGDKPKTAQIEHTPILPHATVPPEVSQRTGGHLQEADLPVEAPIDRSPAYTPPDGSRKFPDVPVKAFAPEGVGDDPVEIIGNTADAAPANPTPARAPTPDVMLHTSVRQAMRKLHDGEPGSGAVEKQIMNALTFTSLNEGQRIKRLQELTGGDGFRTAEDRSEHLGAGGPSGPKGVRVV
jgi:hypothetical protein